MSLDSLPHDVLYSVAEFLLSTPATKQSLFETFYERRRVIYPLISVCRSFRAVFEPLLYHSLCVHLENLDEQVLHDETNGCVQKRLRLTGPVHERDLWRTLRKTPALIRWTRRLELVWDEVLNQPDMQKQMELVLNQCVNLIEFHFGPASHCIDQCIFPPWRPYFLRDSAMKCLRQLFIGCAIDVNTFPNLFFLPHLEELTVSCLDSRHLDEWQLPPLATLYTSPVRRLAVSAILSISQWQQMLTWPKELQSFKHNNVGFYNGEWSAINPEVINGSLRPFRYSLMTLELDITDESEYQMQQLPSHTMRHHQLPLPSSIQSSTGLSLLEYKNLSTLSISSLYLFSATEGCSCNTRTALMPRLPRSIRSLTINFAKTDPILHCRSILNAGNNYVWPLDARSKCYEWIRVVFDKAYITLPQLQHLVVRDAWSEPYFRENDPIMEPSQMIGCKVDVARNLSERYCGKCQDCTNWGVVQHGPIIAPQWQFDQGYFNLGGCGYADVSDYDDYGFHDWDWDYPYLEGYGNGDPMFGEESDYSDSMSGSWSREIEFEVEARRREWEDTVGWKRRERSWGWGSMDDEDRESLESFDSEAVRDNYEF